MTMKSPERLPTIGTGPPHPERSRRALDLAVRLAAERYFRAQDDLAEFKMLMHDGPGEDPPPWGCFFQTAEGVAAAVQDARGHLVALVLLACGRTRHYREAFDPAFRWSDAGVIAGGYVVAVSPDFDDDADRALDEDGPDYDVTACRVSALATSNLMDLRADAD